MAFQWGGVIASSQCGIPMRYSIDFVGSTFSILNGMITNSFLTAVVSSRTTCGDRFECDEKISTTTLLPSIPSTIASGKFFP